MKKFLIILFIILFVDNAFANVVDIVCPYCGNVGVEILNDEQGICECPSCKKMLVVIDGTIYVEDGSEYQLEQQIESNKAVSENDNQLNIIDDNTQSINVLDNSGTELNGTIAIDKTIYAEEPEAEFIREETDVLEESTIGSSNSIDVAIENDESIFIIKSSTDYLAKIIVASDNIVEDEVVDNKYEISTISELLSSSSNATKSQDETLDIQNQTNRADSIKNGLLSLLLFVGIGICIVVYLIFIKRKRHR